MGFIAQRTAMDDIGPMLFISLRFLLAGAVIWPFARRERSLASEPLPKGSSRKFWLLGIVFFLGMALQQVGLLGTQVTNAGFLTTMYVVLVPLILLTVLGQRPAAYIWPAAATSLLGIYCLSFDDLTAVAWGDLLVLACAAVWAVHVILVGHYAQQLKMPVSMTCAQFFGCGLLALVAHGVAWQMGWSELGMNGKVLLAALPEIVYAGAFSGGLAFTLQAVGQRYTTPSVAAILMASECLFAALLSAWLLGERLNALGYAGCGLIFASIITVEVMASQPIKGDNASPSHH